jgi:hypothetical protein
VLPPRSIYIAVCVLLYSTQARGGTKLMAPAGSSCSHVHVGLRCCLLVGL